jgi:hypothetical protein
MSVAVGGYAVRRYSAEPPAERTGVPRKKRNDKDVARMANLFETTMLICFGISWPVSVYKSWVSRKTGGKSLFFLFLIEFGYLVGLTGKILFNPSYVIAVYILNILFVTTDIALYFRNRAIEKREGQA